ncbi:MAG TPA: AI-2E family transporter [Ktedonobacteraceae bacterium]
MSSNTTDLSLEKPSTNDRPAGQQRRRRLILALTVLAFIAIAAVVLYALSLIIQAIILLAISALLAYLLSPLVRILQKYMARPLAILIVYLLLAGFLTGGIFLITAALIQQSSSVVQSVQFLLSPAGTHQFQSVVNFLSMFGITTNQVTQFKNQVLSQALGTLSGLLPFLTVLFSNLINILVVITLSVYFVVDGPRIIRWLSLKTPIRQRNAINFLLHALDQSLGGYFRGSLLIAFIGALCIGGVLTLLRVPYAALLGALFFLLYFVPVVGGYIVEALCILAALPQGWVIVLIVTLFMTAFQGFFIGQILSPRIFSKTVGVHPILALFALFAGAELFGILGGFFAIPVVGVLQQIIVALWRRWEEAHPEQFPAEELPPQV